MRNSPLNLGPMITEWLANGLCTRKDLIAAARRVEGGKIRKISVGAMTNYVAGVQQPSLNIIAAWIDSNLRSTIKAQLRNLFPATDDFDLDVNHDGKTDANDLHEVGAMRGQVIAQGRSHIIKSLRDGEFSESELALRNLHEAEDAKLSRAETRICQKLAGVR